MDRKLIWVAFLCLNISIGTQAQIISTIGGNGTAGYSGDGGIATAASIGQCFGIAADNSGNVYFSDYDHHVIRKINSAGIITTIAGTSTAGYSGDGGPAALCQMYHPECVAVDNNGNIFFTDQDGKYIRKINSAGIITTIAGTFVYSCAGDGGPASAAWFRYISGIFPDNLGNLYVSDAGCGTVRKINSAGIITAFAGTGTPSYSGDGGPATAAQLNDVGRVGMDLSGNIYIPDAHNGRIRMVNTSGIISTVCGNGTFLYSGDGGPASAATLGYVTDVVFDPFNNYFIADPVTFTIRKVNASGIINAYTGNLYNGFSGDGGPAIAAQISNVNAIAPDNVGNLYIADNRWNYRIRKITACQNSILNQQPVDQSLCNTGNVSFWVTASNTTGYQWQVNTGSGWNNITDNSVYSGTTTNTLNITNVNPTMNNYQYRVSAINNCGNIFSAPANLHVTAPVTPLITITTSSDSICDGKSATFNSSIINGGPSPVYQWLKNGINTGTNSPAYTDNNFTNGDIISCRLTSNASCLATSTVNSNNVDITVLQNPIVTLDKTPALCTGSSRELDAGNFSSYLWNNGSTSRKINVAAPGTYYVTVSDMFGCLGSDTTTITTLLALPANFLPQDTVMCTYFDSLFLFASGNYQKYLWNTNSASQSIKIISPGIYWLRVTDQNDCTGTDTIVVSPKTCMQGIYIPNAFTPNHDGKNDLFKPIVFEKLNYYEFIIYNRWGELVFKTADIAKGWNGKFSGKDQDQNIFVWICKYQIEGDKKRILKGTVLLIR